MWKPLSRMSNEPLESLQPKQQQRLWIDDVLPLLGELMGETYRDAVEWCLRSGEGVQGQGGEDGKDRIQRKAIESFEANVLSPLDRCYV